MRLKRLELQGFKSFLDRTVLNFEPGVTGVVGPNGCGKSNIVDAILWVMGEQSAKHLRGESMSDVIFNGSENKAPTSMAEVSLVLDGKDINLPPHLVPYQKGDEISITRRLFRDGTAEYLLNKETCRLKDIHEVFMDTGVGRRAYSIIEQGQIDRMINSKPEDRRAIFEEVAGITKYRTKRREAEKKLEATQLNLSRVQDIVLELEKQMRSLRIQATRARKYKEIKTELETADLFILGRKLYSLKHQLDELDRQRQEKENLRSELDAAHAHLDAEVSRLDVLRLDHEKMIQELDQQERDLSAMVQRMDNQRLLMEQQAEHLAQSLVQVREELGQISTQSAVLSTEKELMEKEQLDLEEGLNALSEEIEQLEVDVAQLKEKRLDISKQRNQSRERMAEISNKQVYLKNQCEHGQNKLTEISDTQVRLNQSLTELVVALDGFRENLRALDEKLGVCEQRGKDLESQASDVHSEIQNTSRELTELEKKFFEAREVFQGRKSRWESLSELQENLEGYSPTAKELLAQLEGSGVNARPLAEVLRPESSIETLVETLLGDSVNTLLVPHTESAQELSNLVDQRKLERVGVLAVSELNVSPSQETPMGVTPLLSKIRMESGYEAVGNWKFGSVYLCDSRDQLFQMRQSHPGLTFVTADAELIAHGDRLIHCGKTPSHAGIFARTREIEELATECQRLEQDVAQLDQERQAKLSELSNKEEQHEQLRESLSSVHVERVEMKKEREKIQVGLDRADKDYNSIVHQSQQCSVQMDKIRGELESWTHDLDLLTNEAAQHELAFRQSELDLEAAAAKEQELAGVLGDKRIERSKYEERLQGLAGQIEKLRLDQEALKKRHTHLDQKIQNDSNQIQSLEEQKVQLAEEFKQAEVRRLDKQADLAEAREAHTRTSTELNEIRIQKDQTQESREAAVEELQTVQIQLTQAQSDFEHQKSLASERYQTEAKPIADDTGLSLESLPMFQEGLQVSWEETSSADRLSLLDEHIANLRKKIERYGEVNLTAIQEFEEVEKRHIFLTEQKGDLEKSIEILNTAIQKIDETSKTRFAETFDGVNSKFKEVFPILFNGGSAQLSLTASENVLDAGVEIMVQPPGKRLQSMNLLSGGEKALTAVSLILAIFARKPSPFCLLDEVDAPLDDANVARFNTVVNHMAQKSQFIVITHNRKTMEVADALYGVTMEQSGVSKMTSVRLH